MSEYAAQSWLATHHDIIPALEIHHREALKTLEDHNKTVGDLADIVALDPGLSVSLYHEVNARLHQSGGREIESVQAALALLGDSALADFVMQHRVLEKTHPDKALRQSYHQLMSRSYHLLAQLDHFIGLQGIRKINEIRSAALLHNIGEFCACLFDQPRYQQYQARFHAMGIDANSAKPVFGFDFHELGRQYAKKAFLPPLVTESLDENIPAGREARLIQLAADVSHQAEEGWYHSSMRATEEVCAAYLNQSLEGFDKQLQAIAIASARSCPLDDVLPAAARLIMLPDLDTPAKQISAAPEAQSDNTGDFGQRLKTLLESAQVTQQHLMDMLADHLHDNLHLSRVVFLMLSQDGDKIGARTWRGIDRASAVGTLVIDAAAGGLLESLLSKPQALWIDHDSYPKYEASLPAKFRSSFLSESFFLMSLLVEGKPAGIVYCDRALAVTRLDEACYRKFKSAVALASNALTRLSAREIK